MEGCATLLISMRNRRLVDATIAARNLNGVSEERIPRARLAVPMGTEDRAGAGSTLHPPWADAAVVPHARRASQADYVGLRRIIVGCARLIFVAGFVSLALARATLLPRTPWPALSRAPIMAVVTV